MSDEIKDDAPLTPEEERDALAAELALGLLDGEEAQAAVARMSSDPEFALAVRDWQERLSGMGETLTPVSPPAYTWQSIREKLGHRVAPLSDDPLAAQPWWRGPKGWLTGLLAVAAIAAVIWLPGQMQGPETAPSYQAQLASEDQSLKVAAILDGRQLEIALEQGAAAEDRDFEVWWIKPDGSAPISLGLVPKSGTATLELPEGLEPAEGVQIALSDEPAGGSPTGEVTGPVLAAADLTSS